MQLRAAELEPTVRAAAVVVFNVLLKDCSEVARSDDQDPIEALGLDRLHPPLCEGVGVSRQQHLIPTERNEPSV